MKTAAMDVVLESGMDTSYVLCAKLKTLVLAGHVDRKLDSPTGPGRDTALGLARVSVRRFLTIKQC